MASDAPEEKTPYELLGDKTSLSASMNARPMDPLERMAKMCRTKERRTTRVKR